VRRTIRADLFVLSAGAINSAALLQRSATQRHPKGLANSSDVVGRYFMNHNCTGLMAIHPFRRNDTSFPKTLAINDYYFGDADDAGKGPPLGNLQLLGKLREPMLRGAMPRWMPRAVGRAMTSRSVDWYVMSEDLPHRDSTVRLNTDGSIDLRWHRTNLGAHRRWVGKATAILRKAGYPLILTRPFDMTTPSHQCGTVRFGADPATSALDPLCKAWDHDNLYVVDAGFFPSSAAVNPASTDDSRSVAIEEARRCSTRSSVHRTGTPKRREAIAINTTDVNTAAFTPNEPPESGGDTSRSLAGGNRSAAAATPWSVNGPWKFDQAVTDPAAASQAQITPAPSTGVHEERGWRNRRRTTTSAPARAAAASP